MLYALALMLLGGAAVLFSKFVMPKIQVKVEAKAAEQRAILDAKKAAKAAKKEAAEKDA